MSFRFWRRIRIAPGVTLNLSKSSASLSLGPRGAKYTISPHGNRVTAGLPGTGLFYTVRDGSGKGSGAADLVTSPHRLNLGFFRRLVTAPQERLFIDGIKAMNAGDSVLALSLFEQCAQIADAAWMAGMLCLQADQLDRAQAHFLAALVDVRQLGAVSSKYGINARAQLPVTTEVDVHVGTDEKSTRLVLAEIAQTQGLHQKALQHLEQLLLMDPDDPVVQVAFAELVLDAPQDRALLDRVVRSTAAVGNETPVHTAVHYYRAKALAALGMPVAAIDVLTLANRRHKDRSASLMQQIRYDRAMLYEQVGRRADARREFERLYAQNPDFEDVAQRVS
jgi:tetratricopeptide (TPR) repeat protein